MQIWIDGDACPKAVKDILFKAAERKQIKLTIVANQPLAVPPSRFIHRVQVGAGYDAADAYIVEHLASGDLVITADVPLASEVVSRGALALNPRGECYSTETIKERLAMRDFMETLRSSGVQTGGPAPLSAREVQAFANQLDKFLAQIK